MTDLDGNVKIGELVYNVNAVINRFSQVTGGLFWCDRGETMPVQLLPAHKSSHVSLALF